MSDSESMCQNWCKRKEHGCNVSKTSQIPYFWPADYFGLEQSFA